MGKIIDWLKHQSMDYLVGSAALAAASNPIFSLMETTADYTLRHLPFVGDNFRSMSDELSLNARLWATATLFAGMGYAVSKGRDFSRRISNISDKSKEGIKTLHDSLYFGGVNLVISPILYFAAGARDPRDIVTGTAAAVGFGLVLGPHMGYAVDLARDLTGLEECNRRTYPDLIKRQNNYTKKGLAGLLLAGSLGINAGIYALTPDRFGEEEIISQPRETVENFIETG